MSGAESAAAGTVQAPAPQALPAVQNAAVPQASAQPTVGQAIIPAIGTADATAGAVAGQQQPLQQQVGVAPAGTVPVQQADGTVVQQTTPGGYPATNVPAGYGQQQVGMYGQQQYGQQQGMYGQQMGGMYGQQQGMFGQQMGGMYGQQQGMMGMPGQPGQPMLGPDGQPMLNPDGTPMMPQMVPQFNMRTVIRFLMEMAAVVQGTYMLGPMVQGWMKDQSVGPPGTPEGEVQENPLKKIGSAVFGFMKSALLAMTPAFVQRRRLRNKEQQAMIGAWAEVTESLPPQQPSRWWIYPIWAYLLYSALQEYRTYHKLCKIPVAAGEASGDGIVPQQNPQGADAGAGGGANAAQLEKAAQLYVQKQREMGQRRAGAPASAPTSTQNNVVPHVN